MNIIFQIKDLKDFLLKKFKDQTSSGKEVTQPELEDAIREHQGGRDQCGYNSAKSLINLLWRYHSDELKSLYKLVKLEGLAIEIQDTIKKAHEEN